MSEEFPVVIFHNPACGTSRNVVAMVEAAGYTPKVVEYIKAGWTHDQIEELAHEAGVAVRELLRDKGTPAADLGLTDPSVSDARLVDAMVTNPILVNRPIVVTPLGVRLCRPSERVLDLLERGPSQFTKEDGQIVR